ncbi:MAG: TonB-dependent receptor, partial [Bacteroidetes bacterium]
AQASKSFFEERMVVSAGLRADANDYDAHMSNLLNQISPRLSVSYAVTEKWFLNMNVGRYFKRPEYTTLGYRNMNNVLANKDNGIKYIASNHYVGGVEWQPIEKAKITGEFFYKTYEHYPFSVNDSVALSSKGADYGVVGNEEVLSIGEGRSYGFELFTRLPSYKKFNLILSYTFVRSEFKDAHQQFIPTAWDNRHILNLTLMKSFNQNWEVGVKWRYVGGAPYTPYDIEKSQLVANWDIRNQPYLDYARFNSLRLGAFHQLDIRIDKNFYFNKFEAGFYIDIQNVYNFQSDNPDYLTNLDENGNVNINPNNPDEYILRNLKSGSGTILPTIGLKVAF